MFTGCHAEHRIALLPQHFPPQAAVQQQALVRAVQQNLGLFPAVVQQDADAPVGAEQQLAQLPVGKRDVIRLSYFLGMTDREISEKLNIVHQTVSKRRRATLKELREYLVKEGFEWPDE